MCICKTATISQHGSSPKQSNYQEQETHKTTSLKNKTRYKNFNPLNKSDLVLEHEFPQAKAGREIRGVRYQSLKEVLILSQSK